MSQINNVSDYKSLKHRHIQLKKKITISDYELGSVYLTCSENPCLSFRSFKRLRIASLLRHVKYRCNVYVLLAGVYIQSRVYGWIIEHVSILLRNPFYFATLDFFVATV